MGERSADDQAKSTGSRAGGTQGDQGRVSAGQAAWGRSAVGPIASVILGVGNAGCAATDQLMDRAWPETKLIAVNTDAAALERCRVPHQYQLGKQMPRGMSISGNPEWVGALAEEEVDHLKDLCEGIDLLILVTALGGGTGTGVSPVLARVAKEYGVMVVVVTTLPFDWEGSLRAERARRGLHQLKVAADAVICLPNERIVENVAQDTGLRTAYEHADRMLDQVLRSLGRLLLEPGFVRVSLSDLCALVRGREMESHLISAAAEGPDRCEEIAVRLLEQAGEHEGLKREKETAEDGGDSVGPYESVLVHIEGEANLSMVEMNRLLERLHQGFPKARFVMGANLDGEEADRLSVNLLLSRRSPRAATTSHADLPGGEIAGGRDSGNGEPFGVQAHYENRVIKRPPYPYVPPPPELTSEDKDRLLRQQQDLTSWGWYLARQLRPGQFPLEVVASGRFDKSEPTIHHGEDLDVPTYVRRGVRLR